MSFCTLRHLSSRFQSYQAETTRLTARRICAPYAKASRLNPPIGQGPTFETREANTILLPGFAPSTQVRNLLWRATRSRAIMTSRLFWWPTYDWRAAPLGERLDHQEDRS
jgi:hypothetical protein